MLVHKETGWFCRREIQGGLHRLHESHAHLMRFLSGELLEAGRAGRCCAGVYIWPDHEQKCLFLISFEFVTFHCHTQACVPARGLGMGSTELHSSWAGRDVGKGLPAGQGTWTSNWVLACPALHGAEKENGFFPEHSSHFLWCQSL